jgi:DNA-3-methyladenine glycosylase
MALKPNVLPSDFYQRDVRVVARQLLGMHLVSQVGGRRTAGIIVETEGYLARGDSACHGARKRTPRNDAMFAPGGQAYVYLIHARYCFNAVTGAAEQPSAVLIRAIQPLEGIETMQQRRGTERLIDLARGPARLCQALGIGPAHNRLDLTAGQTLWIESPRRVDLNGSEILVTRRIGVTSATELPLRFALHPHPFVSGPRNWR